MVRVQRTRLCLFAGLSLALGLTACGSGGSGGSGGQGANSPLEIAVFSPFSGPNADYGFFEYAGCPPAVRLINADGGVLGHDLTCTIVDNRGDPADAVPAAAKMLATSPHLVAIIDGDSGLLSATVPMFNKAHIPDLSCGGDVQFDTSTYPYFWRTIPGDDVSGYAVAAYIHFKTKYTRIAAVFANDQAAQGNVPGLLKGAQNLGLHIVVNKAIALDSTTYETEIAQIRAAHPQVMATESDPQTAGVLLGELQQAGALMPMIGTSGTLGTDYNKAAVAAIGSSAFTKDFVRLTLYAPSAGPAWQVWDRALLASASQVQKAATYANQIYAEVPYDNVNMVALAMLAAKSTTPSVFNPYIRKITEGSTIVHTFAQGKAALAAGKTIDYVGVEGPVHFDRYQNSAGVWAALNPITNGTDAVLTPAQVSTAEGR
jgi:ABC-type branched-subunit amino acid transport system substrate-binding protein